MNRGNPIDHSRTNATLPIFRYRFYSLNHRALRIVSLVYFNCKLWKLFSLMVSHRFLVKAVQIKGTPYIGSYGDYSLTKLMMKIRSNELNNNKIFELY